MTPTTSNAASPRITPNCRDGNHAGCSGCDCAHHRGSPAAAPDPQPAGRWSTGPTNIRDLVRRARERKQAQDEGGAATSVAAFLGVVALIVAVAVGGWLLSVALSDPVGRGEATKQVNRSDNRLAQQAWFEQTYADIKAADQNLDLPGNDTEQAGRTAYCRRLVADYDAAARKEIAAKFRAADLPAQIDPTDPATNCRKG